MGKKGIKLLLIFVALSSFAFSQKVMLLEGDGGFDFIVSQPVVNVAYDFTDYSVGKYASEEEYVNKKVTEGNEKEDGKGDRWKESWYGSRERVYQPKFESLFNKTLKKKGVSIDQGEQGVKYTLTVKTTFIEPGFNIGIASRPSAVSFEYIFTNSDGDVVARLSQKMVPGSQAMGMDFDTSTRISESYAKAGKMLAGHIYKKIKKK